MKSENEGRGLCPGTLIFQPPQFTSLCSLLLAHVEIYHYSQKNVLENVREKCDVLSMGRLGE